MRPIAARSIVLVVLVFLSLSGCGYSLVRYGGSLGEVRTVAIATPRNTTFEPGIEYVVADALRREFLRRGAVRLISDADQADLVLSGKVVTVASNARSFSSVVLTLEYEIVLGLDLVARRRDGSQVPLDSRSLRESERYLASADIEATRKNRQEALHRLSVLLAGRIHDSLRESLVQ